MKAQLHAIGGEIMPHEGESFKVIILKNDAEEVEGFEGIRAEGIPTHHKLDVKIRTDLGVHDVIEFRTDIMIDRHGDELWCYRGGNRPLTVYSNMSALILEI